MEFWKTTPTLSLSTTLKSISCIITVENKCYDYWKWSCYRMTLIATLSSWLHRMKPQSLTFSFTWSKITPKNAISLKFGTVGSKCVDVLNLLQFVEGITNSIFLAEFGLQAHSFENGTEKNLTKRNSCISWLLSRSSTKLWYLQFRGCKLSSKCASPCRQVLENETFLKEF